MHVSRWYADKGVDIVCSVHVCGQTTLTPYCTCYRLVPDIRGLLWTDANAACSLPRADLQISICTYVVADTYSVKWPLTYCGSTMVPRRQDRDVFSKLSERVNLYVELAK